LNTVDVSLENFVRISIDGNVNRFSRANISDLALFEVRGHPNFARHDRQQRLPTWTSAPTSIALRVTRPASGA